MNDGPLTVYIAGPMTGLPDDNYPAFLNAECKLLAAGYRVLNPARNFDGRHGLPRADYLRQDAKMLMEANLVVLLPGWEKSKGVREMELPIAKALHLPLYEYPSMEQIDVTIVPAERDMTILEEADVVTRGDRNHYYGHPLDNHTRTAGALRWYIQSQFGVDLDIQPEHVCWINVLQKLSREMHCPKRDNLVDTAGWARNIEMIQDERQRRAELQSGEFVTDWVDFSDGEKLPGERAA